MKKNSLNKTNFNNIYSKQSSNTPRGYFNLNSRDQRNHREDSDNHYRAQNNQKEAPATIFNFETQIGSIKGPTMPIRRLDRISPSSIENWVTEVRTLFSLNRHTQEEQIGILKLIINPEIDKLILEEEPDKKLDNLLKLAFPRSDKYLYDNILRTIKLSHIKNFKEFKHQFDLNINHLNSCLGNKEKLTERETVNYLENSLPTHYQKEIYKRGLATAKEIFDYVSKEEDMKIRFGKEAPTPQYINSTSSTEFKNKWCRYHRSRYHNTDECLKGNSDRKTKETNPKENKHFLISENRQKTKEIILEAKVKEKTMGCLIDTGAQYNCISRSCLNRLSIEEHEEIVENKAIQTANNSIERIKSKVILEVQFAQIPDKIFRIEYLVMDTLPIDANIGYEFLKEYNAILNFQENEIIIDNFALDWERNPEKEIDEEITETILSKNMVLKERNTIAEMIERYKKENPEVGSIPDIEHEIKLTKKFYSTPREYTIPYKLKPMVEEKIQELLDKQIIIKSKSEFAAPAFPIPKSDKTIRLVVDYRLLNQHTIKDPFPFPELRDQLMELRGSKVFSQIDLASGYYQIKVKKSDTHKTAFLLCGMQYEFLRMPFGLTNSPKTFQRAMRNLLGHFSFVKIFLDDILIHSKDYKEHMEHLLKVFEVLKKIK